MRFMEPVGIRYVRPVRPVDFPASDPEWEMGEGLQHRRLCDLIHELLRRAVTGESSVGCNQFVYFDASDAQRKCAPDAFVCLDVPQELFDTWKTWEKGAPELCVEILSPSETREKLPLEEKLARFHTMGVEEVIAFDVEAPIGKRLRAWDLVSGDLVERVVEGETTPCRTLGLWFVIAQCADLGLEHALRLAEDSSGKVLVLSPVEVERAQKERALAELAHLRAELAKRG